MSNRKNIAAITSPKGHRWQPAVRHPITFHGYNHSQAYDIMLAPKGK